MMRLLADENIQELTVRFLRNLGYDVSWTNEVGLRATPDSIIFQYAQKEQRVVLTYNGDFADIRELSKTDHHGIIRLRIENQRVSHVNPILQAAFEQLKDINLRNTLVTLTDEHLRIRNTSLL